MADTIADEAVEPWHGTAAGYRDRRCRCPACRNYNTRRHKARRRRARDRDPRVVALRAANEASLARESVEPIAGERFRRAATLDIEGAKRRKLLCLLAAYADAGEPSPPMRELVRRLGLPKRTNIDGLLKLLERDGFLRVRWGSQERDERNVYDLRLPHPAIHPSLDTTTMSPRAMRGRGRDPRRDSSMSKQDPTCSEEDRPVDRRAGATDSAPFGGEASGDEPAEHRRWAAIGDEVHAEPDEDAYLRHCARWEED
jgi:hypothetical protein